MRTASKIVLIIIIITLVYSVVKLINASTTQTESVTITLPINKISTQSKINGTKPSNNQVNQSTATVNNLQTNSSQNTVKSPQKLYHADEILIDGQGQAGQNYIDITSTTPITPQQQAQANTANSTQNNNGGTYAQASVIVENNNANSSAQTYAPGVPAFEVIDGN